VRSKFHISSLHSMEIGPCGILFVGKGEEWFFSMKGKSSPECKLLTIQLAGCNKIWSRRLKSWQLYEEAEYLSIFLCKHTRNISYPFPRCCKLWGDDIIAHPPVSHSIQFQRVKEVLAIMGISRSETQCFKWRDTLLSSSATIAPI
jgi:hypothetical protein